MDFKEYQKKAGETSTRPIIQESYVYPTLGLVGEAGEIAEKVKKIFRDEGGILSEAKREELKKELGDVLWYLSQVAAEMGIELDEVAELNIAKLASRKTRGVISGDGDNR